MAKQDSNERSGDTDAASRSKKSKAARDAMAKGASSTKTSGLKSPTGERRDLGFPAAVAAVVVLGIGAVLFSRSQLSTPGSTEPRLLQDHWHSAFGVYICDNFLPNLVDTQGDARGVHTHDDGIIHIHPSSALAAGENAQIGDFLFEVGIDLTDEEMTLPNGDTYANGDECPDGSTGVLKIGKRTVETAGGDPEIITSNLNDARFLQDREVWTLAFVPEDADIPAPPTVQGVDEVTDVIEAPTTTLVGVDDQTNSEGDGADESDNSGSTDTTTADESGDDGGSTDTTAADE